jgi:hypothetical protein
MGDARRVSPGEERHQAILAEIAALGPVLPGSITERSTRCQTGSCHCRADPPVLHGPYPTWTHRAGGRQVTRTLTPEQASQLRPFIDADRRLHQLVRELEALTLAAIQHPQPRGQQTRATPR